MCDLVILLGQDGKENPILANAERQLDVEKQNSRAQLENSLESVVPSTRKPYTFTVWLEAPVLLKCLLPSLTIMSLLSRALLPQAASLRSHLDLFIFFRTTQNFTFLKNQLSSYQRDRCRAMRTRNIITKPTTRSSAVFPLPSSSTYSLSHSCSSVPVKELDSWNI